MASRVPTNRRCAHGGVLCPVCDPRRPPGHVVRTMNNTVGRGRRTWMSLPDAERWPHLVDASAVTRRARLIGAWSMPVALAVAAATLLRCT